MRRCIHFSFNMRNLHRAKNFQAMTNPINNIAAKGLITELAPPHVQSAWKSRKKKGFELLSLQHVVIISKKNINNIADRNLGNRRSSHNKNYQYNHKLT